MAIDKDTVAKLAALARIELSSEEMARMTKDFDSILGYVAQIHEVSSATSGTLSPAAVRNVMREDAEPHESGAFTESLLSSASGREGAYVKVKKIL